MAASSSATVYVGVYCTGHLRGYAGGRESGGPAAARAAAAPAVPPRLRAMIFPRGRATGNGNVKRPRGGGEIFQKRNVRTGCCWGARGSLRTVTHGASAGRRSLTDWTDRMYRTSVIAVAFFGGRGGGRDGAGNGGGGDNS